MALGFLLSVYLVAISIALALIALPFLEYAATHRIHFFVLIASVGAGATILRALIPERTPWNDPGPRITAAQHPRLFARIARIAGQMGVAMPTEVYLIPEMNAFVTERGGFLGLGARRVMAIGVPMLAIENVSQLDATLAHELGHYAGGETRLSGVVYATRRAMVATVAHLEARGSGLLQKPFRAMLAAYMRITQAISRQQELLADSWSVRLAGREAHVTGLGLVHTHGPALEVFVRRQLEPLHRAGCAPANVFEGYRRLLAEHGWTLTAEVGEPVGMRLGDTTLDLRARLRAVIDGVEPVAALRAVAPDVLRDGVVLTLIDAERPSPAARVPTVVFTRGTPYSELRGRLRDLVFPACCARCTGPTDTQYVVTVMKEGLSIGSTGLTLQLYSCPRHVSDIGRVIRLRRHDKQTDQVVLAVLSGDYAELIARASEPAA